MTRPSPQKVSLVFCDVDGTLVTKDKRLTPAAEEAVGLLRAAGIRFAIASSRPPRGLASVAAALDLDMPLSAFNGGLIVGRDGAVISRNLLPRSVAQEALATLESAGTEVWVFTPQLWLVKDPAGAYVPLERRTVDFAPTLVADFSPYLDEVGKIVGVSADFEFLARSETEMAKRLGAAASVARSQAYYLDITDPHANKAEALDRLTAHFAIAADEIVAIGDGLNDIGMLQKAAFAIAMGNASEAVQAVADFVTASNDDDGFAKAASFILQACRPVEGALR